MGMTPGRNAWAEGLIRSVGGGSGCGSPTLRNWTARDNVAYGTPLGKSSARQRSKRLLESVPL